MENENLKKRILELKTKAEDLLSKDYITGKDQMYELQSELQMIIRRIYPDYQKLEERLIGEEFYWDTDDIEDTKVLQEWFIRDLKLIIRGINTILSEDELFGIKDFTPLKEKNEEENETSIGLHPKNIFWRSKTKTSK